MAFVIADRVRETAATTGTGNFTLTGAVTGYQTFDAALADGDTTFYTIGHRAAAEWEVGLGTFTEPATLARTTVISSSNSNNAVNFSAGTKDVFIAGPSTHFLSKGGVAGGQTVTGGTASGDDLKIRSTSNATKGDIELAYDGGNVILGGGATASRLRILEASGSGTNYTEFVAQAQGANITYTLPADDGDADEVLTTDGSGGLSWNAPSAGAMDWELLGTASASSSASVTFTGLSSTYIQYKVIFTNILAQTDGAVFRFRTSTDGGSTYDAGASDYGWVQAFNTGGLSGASDTADSEIEFTGTTGNVGSGEFICGEIWIFNPAAAAYTNVAWILNYVSQADNFQSVYGSGRRLADANVDAIQFIYSSGNITSGEFRLYGLRAA